MQRKRYELMFRYEQKHWWYRGRRFLLSALLKSLKISGSAKLLDVGCGTGYTFHALKQFGKVYGVDIETSAIAFCKERGFTNVHLTNGTKLPFRDNFFDVVTCLDVLEHIKDELPALLEMRRVLKPNGHLIIFSPALPSLWSSLDTRSHHFRRYTKQQLKNLCYDADLQLKEIRFFNFLLLAPIFLVRQLQRTKLGKTNKWGLDPYIGSVFINFILTLLFTIDTLLAYYLQFPIGVSIYLIGRKKYD